ncbi:mechanosensitive ion channel domain-containing protein [candidate division KSB1 bacterium]
MDTVQNAIENSFFVSQTLGSSLYKFLLIGVIIFIFFRIANKFLPLLFNKSLHRRYIRRYFPVIEITTWILFFIWFFQYYLIRNLFFAGGIFFIFLVLMVIFAWFILKDYIVGVFFKLSGRLQLNDHINIKNFHGKITNLGNRFIEIEAETGETIFIPYHFATSEIILKADPSYTAISHSFQILTSKNESLAEIINSVREAILQLPWSSPKKEPQIHLNNEDDTSYKFNITVFSIAKEYLYLIEQQLRDQFKTY